MDACAELSYYKDAGNDRTRRESKSGCLRLAVCTMGNANVASGETEGPGHRRCFNESQQSSFSKDI